jgi:hypothetical protein
MRKFGTQVGCVIIAMTLAMGLPPAAQADGARFIAEARAAGFTQIDDLLIRMALSACRFLQPHLRRHPAEVAGHIERHANNVTPDQANRFMVISVNEYCPQLAYRLGQ